MPVESELYLRGWSFSRIAEEISRRAKEAGDGYKLTHQTIFIDMKALRKQWVAEQDRNIGQWVAEQLKKIDVQERRNIEAWENSQKNLTTQTQKTIRDKDGKVSPRLIEQTKRIEEKTGVPSYLAGIDKCIEMRCRILHITDSGAAIPQSVEMTAKEIEKATEAFEAAAPGGGGLFVDYGTGEDDDETDIDIETEES